MEKIRIALIGSVSVGKSTLLNALFVKQFSKTRIKRTTMLPYVFQEEEKVKFTADKIKKISDEVDKTNQDIIKLTESDSEYLTLEKLKPVYFSVPKIFDLSSSQNGEKIRFEFYDIPGLDDNRTKKIYFEWVTNNFNLFDIIIFITSIESAMNTSGELENLQLVLSNMKDYKEKYQRNTELIVLVNKCDNMMYENDKLQFMESDDEYEELFNQIEEIIKNETAKYGITHYSGPLQISAEDSFIYRTAYQKENNFLIDLDDKYINKLGINEYGKIKWNKYKKTEYVKYKKKLLENLQGDKSAYLEHMRNSGYLIFRDTLNNIMKNNMDSFLHERMNYGIFSRQKINETNYDEYLKQMFVYLESENKINELCNNKKENIMFIICDDIDKHLKEYISLNSTDLSTTDELCAVESVKSRKKRCEEYGQYLKSLHEKCRPMESDKILKMIENHLFHVIKYYTNSNIEYMKNTNINHKIDSIEEIIKFLLEDQNKIWNLELDKELFCSDIDEDFINKFNCALDILFRNLSSKLQNYPMASDKDIFDQFFNLLCMLIDCNAINDYRMLEKFMIDLYQIRLNKLSNCDIGNIIHLYQSKIYLESVMSKYNSLLPLYMLVNNKINKMQINDLISDEYYKYYENEKLDLRFEKLFVILQTMKN